MGFLDSLPLTYSVEYEGGHPNITKDGDVSVTIKQDTVTVSKGIFGGIFTFSVSSITDIRIETQHEIERRYTATRLVLLGPLALAFKKKKDIKHKYLTIEFSEGVISYLVVFTGNHVPQVHAEIANRIKKYGSNSTKSNEEKSTDMDLSKTLKELKSLLDEGILTQDEFNEQKKRILNS